LIAAALADLLLLLQLLLPIRMYWHVSCMAPATYVLLLLLTIILTDKLQLCTHLPSASHSLRSTIARLRDMIGGRYLESPTFLNCSAASPNRRSM
jgi:hypothetical protein